MPHRKTDRNGCRCTVDIWQPHRQTFTVPHTDSFTDTDMVIQADILHQHRGTAALCVFVFLHKHSYTDRQSHTDIEIQSHRQPNRHTVTQTTTQMTQQYRQPHRQKHSHRQPHRQKYGHTS